MVSMSACWNRNRLAIVLILLLTAGLAACSSEGGGGGSPAEMGKVTLSLPLPGSASREKAGLPGDRFAPAPAAVQSIRVEASGPGIPTPVSQLLVRGVDFTESTDPVTVTLEVPAGLDRVFVARAFASSDGSGEPLYQGSTVGVTIVAGVNRVDIFLFTPPFAAPALTDFTPSSGCNGATVTINGTNFDPIAGNNTILFLGEIGNPDDDRMATMVGTPTPTRLMVTVPAGTLSGPIQVGNLRGNVASATDFTVSACAQGSLLFGTQVNLSHNAGFSGSPSVAVSGNSVFVAWHDGTSGNFEIFLARSTDGGKTFGSPVNLSNNAGESFDPSVAISGDSIVVAWDDATPGNFEIFLAHSADGGATFGSPVNLSNNARNSFAPSVAVSENSVVVAWNDETPGNQEIFLARSTNGGKTFNFPVNLSNNAGTSFDPSVAVSGNSVVVAWNDETPGNQEIFLARSTNGGKTFNFPINLSNNAGRSFTPSVVVSGDSVIVAWNDETPGNFEIFLVRSADGAGTFTHPVNFSNNAGTSLNPLLAISEDGVVVAWDNERPGNHREIFLARSADGGATFGPPVNLSQNNAGASFGPSVAVSGNSVVVAWNDETSGNFEIFLARIE